MSPDVTQKLDALKEAITAEVGGDCDFADLEEAVEELVKDDEEEDEEDEEGE